MIEHLEFEGETYPYVFSWKAFKEYQTLALKDGMGEADLIERGYHLGFKYGAIKEGGKPISCEKMSDMFYDDPEFQMKVAEIWGKATWGSKKNSGQDSEELLGIDEFEGYVLGVVGIRLEDLVWMTPALLFESVEQFIKNEERLSKERYELTRLQAFWNLQPYTDKPNFKPEDLIQFDWEVKKRPKLKYAGTNTISKT